MLPLTSLLLSPISCTATDTFPPPLTNQNQTQEAAMSTAAAEEEEGQHPPPPFCEARHVAFIRGLMHKTDSFEHVVMEHLKVRNGWMDGWVNA